MVHASLPCRSCGTAIGSDCGGGVAVEDGTGVDVGIGCIATVAPGVPTIVGVTCGTGAGVEVGGGVVVGTGVAVAGGSVGVAPGWWQIMHVASARPSWSAGRAS